MFLKQARQNRNMTLRDVSDQFEARGESMPPSTLSRIEQGKLDPRARRLIFLMDVYGIPLSAAQHLVIPEAQAVDGQRSP